MAALFLAVSFLVWRSVDRAVNVAEASVWMVPIIFFSAYIILAYLSIIVIRRTDVLQWLFLGSILPSFFFVHSLGHLNAVFAAYVFLAWGVTRITDDLRLNIRISLRKSVRAGSVWVVLALSLLIASQYYASAKNFDTGRLIPQFSVSSVSGNLTSKILAMINPGLADISREGLTVDQFILQIQQEQVGDPAAVSANINNQIDREIDRTNPGLSKTQKESLKEETLKKIASANLEMGREQQEFILQEGRRKFSEISGKSLTGDEKVADVFSDAINRKIDQYFGSGSAIPGKTSPLPMMLGIGLFLTVLSLGSALGPVWILLAGGIFWIFMETGLIRIIRVPIEMEVIE